MKKQVLFFVAALASLSLQAQVKVAANGNMSIQGNESTPLSALSIGSAGDANYTLHISDSVSGIFAKKSDYTKSGVGVDAIVLSDASSSNFGLRGRVAVGYTSGTSNNVGTSYGVYGEVLNGVKNNFAIYGQLRGISNCGAAVFGNANNNFTFCPTDRYAGFFHGKVGVVGDLYVNGKIINPTFTFESPSNSDVTVQTFSNENTFSATDRLGTLNTYTYYKSSLDCSLGTVVQIDSVRQTIAAATSIEEMQEATRKHHALNADQLEEVYPELIYDLGDGKKGINYVELVPILVQGINELKAEVEQLKAAASSQRTQRNTTAVDENMVEADIATLAQNDPNPFETSSTIRLNVPESVGEALLVFYDLNGKQIKQLPVETRGRSEHTVTSAEFAPGMYIYALVTDGKVVETRRMLLLK